MVKQYQLTDPWIAKQSLQTEQLQGKVLFHPKRNQMKYVSRQSYQSWLRKQHTLLTNSIYLHFISTNTSVISTTPTASEQSTTGTRQTTVEMNINVPCKSNKIIRLNSDEHRNCLTICKLLWHLRQDWLYCRFPTEWLLQPARVRYIHYNNLW